MKLMNINKIVFLSCLALGISSAFANNSLDNQSLASNKNVVENSQQQIKDATITTKVKALFLKEKLLGDDSASPSITVETVNQSVRLSGTVEEPQQIDTAIKLAKSVDGVKDVASTITVKRKDNK